MRVGRGGVCSDGVERVEVQGVELVEIYEMRQAWGLLVDRTSGRLSEGAGPGVPGRDLPVCRHSVRVVGDVSPKFRNGSFVVGFEVDDVGSR